MPNPLNKDKSECGGTLRVPAPIARPRPRPIGKGKAKETEVQHDPEPENPEDAISIIHNTIPILSAKRKRAVKYPVNEAPAPKKRNSIKAKGDNPSGATSEAPPVRARGSVAKSARLRSSKIPVSHGEFDTGSSVRNRPDASEGESATGTMLMGADVAKPQVKPRKLILRLPPRATALHTNSDGNTLKATRHTKKISGSTEITEQADMTTPNAAISPHPGRRESSGVPCRRSARVAARDPLLAASVDDAAV
jgi:hypothetical protein